MGAGCCCCVGFVVAAVVVFGDVVVLWFCCCSLFGFFLGGGKFCGGGGSGGEGGGAVGVSCDIGLVGSPNPFFFLFFFLSFLFLFLSFRVTPRSQRCTFVLVMTGPTVYNQLIYSCPSRQVDRKSMTHKASQCC